MWQQDDEILSADGRLVRLIRYRSVIMRGRRLQAELEVERHYNVLQQLLDVFMENESLFIDIGLSCVLRKDHRL